MTALVPNSSMLKRGLPMQVKTPDQKRTGLREVGNRYSEKRRGHRMNSRVHVRAEWDHQGKRHVAESFTRVVNPYAAW